MRTVALHRTWLCRTFLRRRSARLRVWMTTHLCHTHDQQRHIQGLGQENKRTRTQHNYVLIMIGMRSLFFAHTLSARRHYAYASSPTSSPFRSSTSLHSLSISLGDFHNIVKITPFFSAAPVQVPAGWAAAMLSLQLSHALITVLIQAQWCFAKTPRSLIHIDLGAGILAFAHL